jgi:hypothetical protein
MDGRCSGIGDKDIAVQYPAASQGVACISNRVSGRSTKVQYFTQVNPALQVVTGWGDESCGVSTSVKLVCHADDSPE